MEVFVDVLKADGWRENRPITYCKGDWTIVFDTRRWMMLGTPRNARIFDVPVPQGDGLDLTAWTLNLITHIFEANDRIEAMSGNS